MLITEGNIKSAWHCPCLHKESAEKVIKSGKKITKLRHLTLLHAASVHDHSDKTQKVHN